jgi:hypothetical protein
LLSLSAEGIGTKWATGPVVKTPAFRSLFQLQNTHRVVGLIMVGGAGAPCFTFSNQVSAAAPISKRHCQKRPEDLVEDF